MGMNFRFQVPVGYLYGYTQGIPWEKRRWLYKDGELFATYQSYYESGYNPAQNDYIRFRHKEPSGEYKTSEKADHMTTVNNLPYEAGQIDSRGVDVGVWDPQPFTDEQWQEMMQWMNMSGSFFNNNSNCTIDGVFAFQQDCDRAIASVDRNLRANGFGSLMTGYFTSQDIGYYESFEAEHETPTNSDAIQIHTDIRFVKVGTISTYHPGINLPMSDYSEKIVLETVKRAIKLTSPVDDKGKRDKDGEKCDKALDKISGGKISSLNALVSGYLDSSGNLAHISDGSGISTQYGTDSPSVPAFVQNTGQPNAHTYLNSAFFTNTSMGSLEARAIILIHEAVHQFGQMRDLDFNPDYDPTKINSIKDPKKREQKRREAQTKGSQNITSALVDNCYPILRVLIKSLSNI